MNADIRAKRVATMTVQEFEANVTYKYRHWSGANTISFYKGYMRSGLRLKDTDELESYIKIIQAKDIKLEKLADTLAIQLINGEITPEHYIKTTDASSLTELESMILRLAKKMLMIK